MARPLLAVTLAVFLCACPEKKSAPAAAVAPPAVKKAEVEFAGKWSRNEVAAAKVVFVAQLEPCLPVPAKPTRFGEEVLKGEGQLFAEFFIPQGTKGHACLYAFDAAGAVVGTASYDKNPVTFEGEGEVVVGPMTMSLVTLAPVPASP
jgi:hypothetical protein